MGSAQLTPSRKPPPWMTGHTHEKVGDRDNTQPQLFAFGMNVYKIEPVFTLVAKQATEVNAKSYTFMAVMPVDL